MSMKKEGSAPSGIVEDEKLKTENPLSEKDEVKQAEERMAKLNNNVDSNVGAGPKNRKHEK